MKINHLYLGCFLFKNIFGQIYAVSDIIDGQANTKYCGDTDKVCKRDVDCRICNKKSPKAGDKCRKHRDCVKGVGRCSRKIKCVFPETPSPISATNAPTSPPVSPPSTAPSASPVSPPDSPPSTAPFSPPTTAPSAPPTVAPVAPPTSPPPTTPSNPLETGKICLSNSQCASNYCDPTTNICYETAQCKAIKHDERTEFDENHAIIIFVGSGFTNVNDWAAKVASTYSVFENYDFFKAGVTQFSSFYVNEVQNSFCNFGCYGIDRLLCCNINTARSVANSCFPGVAAVQTVVVHNDVKYGGAGYISQNVATTSIHPSAPLVAVHELGHSFFDFYDEYSYISSTPSSAYNCDITAGCPKWNDMIADYPNICSSKGCAGNRYNVGESNSFMKALNYNVGPVLTRYTCCSYYALTGTIPPYCNEFIEKGMGLYTYCGSSGYSPDSSLLAEGQDTEKRSFETPGGKKIYIANPAEISLDVNDIETSSNEVFTETTSSHHLKPSFYASSLLDGENDIEDMLQVKVTFVSGEVKDFYVSSFDVVDVPLSEENESVPDVHVKKDTINIVYDYDEHGDVDFVEVRNTVA